MQAVALIFIQQQAILQSYSNCGFEVQLFQGFTLASARGYALGFTASPISWITG